MQGRTVEQGLRLQVSNITSSVVQLQTSINGLTQSLSQERTKAASDLAEAQQVPIKIYLIT